MSARAKRLLGVLAVVALAWLGVWFHRRFEWVPVQVELGPAGAARYDALLAARRLLESFGTPVEVQPVRRGLPPHTGTLLLLGRRERVAPADARALLRWVSEGGHLVTVAPTAEGDPLLAGVGVRVEDVPGAGGRTLERSVVRLGPGPALDALFDARRGLRTRRTDVLGAATGEHGAHLLVLPHGRGLVTVLGDDAFLRNPDIALRDDAGLLWRLTHLGRDGPVWLVRGRGTPSLARELIERGAPVLASALVLLAVAMWTASRRFGPPIPAPRPGRRRLLDHVVASGEFYWRNRAGAVLLRAVRDSLERTLAFRHPGVLGAGRLAPRLARLAGLPVDEVERALAPDAPERRDEFTRAVHALETIRRRL